MRVRGDQESYRGLVAITLLLIAYGSLYPFSIAPGAGNADAWLRFLSVWGGQDSIGDAAGNIALFVPLGFFGAMDRSAQVTRTARLAVVLVPGLLFAFVLQVAQLYIPARDAALVDVFWNGLGLAVGVSLAMLYATVAARLFGRLAAQPLPMATLLVAGLWGAAELMPLVPSIDYQLVKDSLKPLLIKPVFSLVDTLGAAVGLGVLGQALARVVGERASRGWLLLVAVLVLAAKPFILFVKLELSTVIGFGLGCMIWPVLLRRNERQRAIMLLVGVVLVLTFSQLEPFQLSRITNPFVWIPFADVLEGSMLINSRALTASLFLYAAILWLARLCGGPLLGAALLLALWVALLEFVQIFLVGRTPSITGPLWVFLVAVALARLPDTPRSVGGQRAFVLRPDTRKESAPPIPAYSGLWRRALTAFAVATMGALALWVLVQLPGVPYNARELLHGDSHLLAAWMFMMMLLWVGAGAAWVGQQINGARWSIVRIPLAVFAAAMVSLFLLDLSVTPESIRDVTGSSNLHRFVTKRNTWGEQARALFVAIGPNLVSSIERLVRYAAIYAPVVIFLAIAHLAGLQLHRNVAARDVAARVSWLMINSLPWLWLCKMIAFDWSATDNLTELIARQGPLGISGDYYVYAVMAVVAVNAAFVAHVRTLGGLFIAAIVSITCVLIAWWLLNLGLEDQVQKYGFTFSGVQFLLGPDRSDLLSDAALFTRWCALQIAGVVILALGLRLADFSSRTSPRWENLKPHQKQAREDSPTRS